MISDLEKKDKIRSKSRLAELQRRRENILVRKSKIQVNIEKIELQEKEMFNRTREDKSLSYSGIDKLIELFPDKKNRHLKVKSVFQKE